MKYIKRVSLVLIGIWILISIYLGKFFTYDKAKIIYMSLVYPQKTVSINYEGKTYRLLLPLHSVHIKSNVSKKYKKYFCFNFNNSINKYFSKHLNDGWKFKQALGTGYVYSNKNKSLFIIKDKYFRNGYILTYSIQNI